ncbi:DUF4183 domain-containing protein [Bacillus cereus]|uniref:DUF4183 domain-containing protein n=1 Tax=Bacillus cereus TaxID=1396 RepID=A0A9X6B4T8_BACCE|nr:MULTISPECIES: DUF4183 domain-containing protein [Bacillus cereus group]CUB56718.1 hypothetical protein BN2127_JRS10_03816 [Bacillus subtilis]MBG9521808.1 collagen triple helix repeat protein [Bacillus thuringiensis]MBG9522626.1 collagen triple helix repeat protein [Bacillus thuringiensis]MBG9522879.1 collagen triple helix repeat protein [Bacillus thuringiensis]MBG9523148.1 collagen triple helix repeat protein [Bacillus thuringiensis]
MHYKSKLPNCSPKRPLAILFSPYKSVQNTMYHTLAKQDQFVYTNADGLTEYKSSNILAPSEVSYFNLFINGVIQPLSTYTVEPGKLILLSEEPPSLHAPITLQFISIYP